MTDDEFDSLLQEPGLPRARLSGGESERVVVVSALLAFARNRGFSVDEPELDEHVRRRGGSKETEVWDVAEAPRNVLRTLMRRPRRRAPDAYIIP